ncbi:carbohydrate porin [Phenylobacterium aquaticum]|uniref:carbohydrate porin n=1 Tax=Phenylobacterium aquaticum TaxID=1763816 RepID=UPI001F5DABB9|nr:carbohydrate porin [Phenylobacterium aquaticum]MCI3134347.1 carbohydrate porin [Phenylobacterium aquaticum]
MIGRRALAAAILLLGPALSGPANAQASFVLHDTLDLWRNLEGGLKVGDTQLNKLQIAVTLAGDELGQPGWKAHAQYFRTNGERLSGGRSGDIQTASNIEALSTDRLMEAWVEKSFGPTGALRAGLMDLNSDFDSIEPAGLFTGSSHGIAPDLSHSGLNGPSIFPVSALGVHGTWAPRSNLTLRAAAFDGVPGDPAHPKAFATVRLGRRDGALLITQADWVFAPGAQASLGAWRYTADFDRLDQPGRRQSGAAGVYGYVEGPAPGLTGWKGWVRLGRADPDVAVVADYLGFGLVHDAPFRSRPDDQLGFAVARAGLGAPARRGTGLPDTETAFELTYRYQVDSRLSLQPDIQYIVHPASRPGLDNALIAGLRVAVTFRSKADRPQD